MTPAMLDSVRATLEAAREIGAAVRVTYRAGRGPARTTTAPARVNWLGGHRTRTGGVTEIVQLNGVGMVPLARIAAVTVIPRDPQPGPVPDAQTQAMPAHAGPRWPGNLWTGEEV